MGANDTAEQVRAAQYAYGDLEAELRELQGRFREAERANVRLRAEVDASREENQRMEADNRRLTQTVEKSTIAKNYFGLLQERNELAQKFESAVTQVGIRDGEIARLKALAADAGESWANIMCAQFSTDRDDYDGATVIGRIRAIVHAAVDPHEPGVPCIGCDNDLAGEF